MKNQDLDFIGSVLQLYDMLENEGISLVYVGKFNRKITEMFALSTTDETNLNNESREVKRKVHHSVIEILQNMSKHSTRYFTKVKFGRGLFMLGKKNKEYYIITANKIAREDSENLKEAIDEVNEASPEKLREMYKEQLQGGELSEKGGAGLGLIDIARKSGNKLEYHFFDIDKTQQYFTMKVKIPTE